MEEKKYFHRSINKKIILRKYPLLIFQIFLVLNLIMCQTEKIVRKSNVYISEINLIIKGNGNQKLTYESFYPYPSQVLVNGEIKSGCSRTCNLNGDTSNVTLKFTNQVTNCNNMFLNLKNIKEIDLSNFDFSKVTMMDWMFYGCENMEHINFGNINTSSLKRMPTAFYRCFKLTSIDFSNFDFSKVTTMEYLLDYCNNLEYVNFGDINTSSLRYTKGLFQNCSKLTSIDVSRFNFSKVTDMEYMINDCRNLEYINFGNITTSSLRNIRGFFQLCVKLKSIDLSKFDFSKVTNMDYMFNACSNLEYVNFGNTNTNSLESIRSFFQLCPKLKSVDLSKFDTMKVTTMQNMFYGCSSLEYLNLSNFITTRIDTVNAMFYNCYSLKYLNLYSFRISSPVNINNIFTGLSPNVIYCINDDNTRNYLLGPNKISFCSDECFKSQNTKLDINNKICSESCIYSTNNKYEYKNFCYNKCPTETLNYNNICLDVDCNELLQYSIECLNEEPVGYYLDHDNIYQKCFYSCKTCYGGGNEINNNCTECNPNFRFLEDFENDTNCYPLCENDYYFDESRRYHCVEVISKNELSTSIINSVMENDINSVKEKILIIIQEMLNNTFNFINFEEGNDTVFVSKDASYTVTSTSNQKNNKNNNNSIIDLGECENKLKEVYNISLNDSLYILKIDSSFENIQKVEYEVYYLFPDNNLKKLDLSFCKNIKVNILMPVKLPVDEIDKYNMSSDLYNDLCHTVTSEDGTDIPLKDRQEEYVNNYSYICEEDCDFVEYDSIRQKAICSCLTKTQLTLKSDFKINKQKLLSKFKDINNAGNFNALECIDLLFDKNIFFKNISNYMFIILFILGTIAIFIYYYIEKIRIKNFISIKTNNDTLKIKKVSISNNKENTKSSEQNNDYLNSVYVFSDMNPEIKNNETELNLLDYDEAIKVDKRNYLQYYLSLLKTKHILFLTFMQINDYNSLLIKIYIFVFIYFINFVFSAMFYSEETMHKIYVEKGKFDFGHQLPIMIYTLIISYILRIILNILGLYEQNIIEIKKLEKNEEKIIKEYNKINYKIIIFFAFTYILLFFFWIYLGCFCAVYKNTQTHLLLNASLSFIFSFILQIILYLLPGIFRIIALKNMGKSPILYKFSQLLQLL